MTLTGPVSSSSVMKTGNELAKPYKSLRPKAKPRRRADMALHSDINKRRAPR